MKAIELAERFELGPVIGVCRWEDGANSQIGVFETARGAFCAKGRDPAERPRALIEREHGIIDHLVARGFATPQVNRTADGESVVELDGRLWSVLDRAKGEDRYAAASVFAPFGSEAEVRSAGAMLARFHGAMADFSEPLPPASTGLSCRCELALAGDVDAALEQRLAGSPARKFLDDRPDWRQALALFDALRSDLPGLAPGLASGIVHGDWIKRNLFFSGEEVSAVVDFDLACQGPLAYDLALAITAAAYPWAALDSTNPRHADAMRQGYESVRTLSAAESRALPALLATCRFEFHLSLVALLLERGRPDRAAWVWEGEMATLRWWKAQAAQARSCRETPAQSGSSREKTS